MYRTYEHRGGQESESDDVRTYEHREGQESESDDLSDLQS